MRTGSAPVSSVSNRLTVVGRFLFQNANLVLQKRRICVRNAGLIDSINIMNLLIIA
jgi:hypothetical protein